MDQRRAMAVEHALRVARRTRRVAERRRGALVELGPGVVVAGGCNPVLVGDEIETVGRRKTGAVRQHHVALDATDLRRDLLDDRQQVRIEDQHAIFGVADDVGDLLVEQPRVHRVQHGAHARHAVEALDVAVRVPRERRDPVAGTDALQFQCLRQSPRASLDRRVVGAVNAAVTQPRHDLAPAVIRGGVADQRRDEQRVILHQAVHADAPSPSRLRILMTRERQSMSRRNHARRGELPRLCGRPRQLIVRLGQRTQPRCAACGIRRLGQRARSNAWPRTEPEARVLRTGLLLAGVVLQRRRDHWPRLVRTALIGEWPRQAAPAGRALSASGLSKGLSGNARRFRAAASASA